MEGPWLYEFSRELRSVGRRDLTILLLGMTGVGKSSLVNSLFGSRAVTGAYWPSTHSLEEHQVEVGGVVFSVIDSPGFDYDESDAANFARVESIASRVDCVFFLTRLGETRLRSDEGDILSNIASLGGVFLRRLVIVFTYADTVKRADFLDHLVNRAKIVRERLAKASGALSALNTPVVAVSNLYSLTPGGKPWQRDLFEAMLSIVNRPILSDGRR